MNSVSPCNQRTSSGGVCSKGKPHSTQEDRVAVGPSHTWVAHTIRTCGALAAALGWPLLSQLSGPEVAVTWQPPQSLAQPRANREQEMSTQKHILHALLHIIPRSPQGPHPLGISVTRGTVTCTPHAHPWSRRLHASDGRGNTAIHLLGMPVVSQTEISELVAKN